MHVASRFRPYVIAGLSACGGAVISYYYFHDAEKRQAFASWTTNFVAKDKWDYNWDRMDPASLVRPSKGESDDNRYNKEVEQAKPKFTRHLLLIRHGQYNTSAKQEDEKTLTELGRKQAVFTGERLKELNFPYNQLIRSTLVRANETSSYIEKALPDVPVTDCCLLVEGAPIPPEPPIGHWKPEFYFFQDGPRIEAAFRKYFHRAHASQKADSYEILVCHANVIRYFVCRALQFPAEGWLRFTLNHCSITWVSILPSGRVTVRAMGDAGHLPAYAVTSS
ncbi:serine/threonine-protein phosphatase PGAM5, mitochondrial isoform X2 [Anabrus simplex]|uniref:serine/threonine-protein phosphatase PGAM5, mitochondrial isoform X2 n=1 Tax=Anabrus simplex TaxID=316456 RepID=UPI0034DD1A44